MRVRRDIAARAALVRRGLAALDAREADTGARARAYVQRFVQLETTQQQVEATATQLARAADMRLLPTGGGGGGGGGGGLNYNGAGNHMDTDMGMGMGATAAPHASSLTTTPSLLALTRSVRTNHAVGVVDELRRAMGGAAVDLMPADMCPRCNVAMQHNQTTQQLVCPMPGCFHWKRFADMTANGLTYGEDVEYFKYTYRPVTHLDETMRNAEGSETYVVPAADLQRVMALLRELRIRPEQLTIPLVREVLTRLDGIKTDNTVQIYSRLTGRAPRRMTAFMKDQNRILFLQQEEVFRKIAGTRVNNPSFPYTLYKNCELLGYWEMLESFPLLRGQNNLAWHDAIRANVCRSEGLSWQFIPTVPLDGGGTIGAGGGGGGHHGGSHGGAAPSHLRAAIAQNEARAARAARAAAAAAATAAVAGAGPDAAAPGAGAHAALEPAPEPPASDEIMARLRHKKPATGHATLSGFMCARA
jgi:hypothetical protein